MKLSGQRRQVSPPDSTSDKFEATLERFQAKLDWLEAKLDVYHRANFFNQITLANQQEGSLTLYVPWSHGNRQTLDLERIAGGRLSFNPIHDSDKKPVHVVTLPKSGTHLIVQVLTNLGFRHSQIYSQLTEIKSAADCPEMLDDRRTEMLHGHPDLERFIYPFPYPLMVNLGKADGVSYIGHITRAGAIYQAHRTGQLLLSVRDLRVAMVSQYRWLVHIGFFSVNKQEADYPANDDLASALLLNFLGSEPKDFLFGCAKAYSEILNEPFGHLVRFEEMTSPAREIMRPSAEAIAAVTGCTLEEVFQAVEHANGQQTYTYSGQHSQLGDFWTQEVEDKFIELGGDVLNEQLGYSRHYTPGSGAYSVTIRAKKRERERERERERQSIGQKADF